MERRNSLLALALLLLTSCGGEYAVTPVRGSVVDRDGEPVAGAQVARFWEIQRGAMEPSSRAGKETTDGHGRFEGRFNIEQTEVPLLAIDVRRRRGGLTKLSLAEVAEPCVIQVSPLVQLQGRIVQPASGEQFLTASLYVTLTGSAVLASGYPAQDGSFALDLPPGAYSLGAHGAGSKRTIREIELPTGEEIVDVGDIELEPTIIRQLEGKPPPAWSITAARDLPPTVTLADMEGKWLLLEFWGYW